MAPHHLLIGDRFIPHGPLTALDLATGELVTLVVRRFSEAAQHEAACEARAPAVLCDWGRAGTEGWFNAKSSLVPGGRPEIVQPIVEHVCAATHHSSRGVRVVRATPPSADAAPALAWAIASRVRREGIVPIRSDLALPPAVLQTLLGRHLAIFCFNEAGEAGAAAWIRRLSTSAFRGHVVFDLRARGDRGLALASDRRLTRADACFRRGRRAAGARWLRAAFEGARRRGDDEAHAEAGCRLAEAALARDDVTSARRITFDLLRTVVSWEARVVAAAAAGRVLLACGELRRVDGLCSSIASEAHVLGQPLPVVIRLRHAQTRFWQGRFEEAGQFLVTDERVDPELHVWRTLVRWAGGEDAGQLEIDDSGLDRLPRRLAAGCRAERLLTSGQPAVAARLLGSPPERPSDARLEEALLNWLRAKCVDTPAARAAAESFIRRAGARGIVRWGMGRTGMHLLHAVPDLLNIIREGDDDAVVLTEGCRWIRAHAGADAAAIVTHDGGRVIAAEGCSSRDLGDVTVREAIHSEGGCAIAEGPTTTVAAKLRAGGATIGVVIARGPSPSAGTLSEAVTAVAAICAPALRARLDRFAEADSARSVAPEILGRSPAVHALREAIARAATTPFSVLVEGESGTGKELVARAIHRLSPRRDRRFCAINCAALSDELLEPELFGHTRGAFTGAIGPRTGLFEEANAGTLFLDEIGELSPRGQAKLLRVLQEREIRRVGENISRPVDVRVVAATNRVLEADPSVFRDDLRFRLAVVRLRLPPLRERLEDIPLLAQAFWRELTNHAGKRGAIGPDAFTALCRHDWPGNVRELQNVMASLVVLVPPHGRVSARHVEQVLAVDYRNRPVASVVPLQTARKGLEKQVVTAALVRHAGRRSQAARELGISRQGLSKAIKRLGVTGTS